MKRPIAGLLFCFGLLAGCHRQSSATAEDLVEISELVALSKLGLPLTVFPRADDRASKEYRDFLGCIDSHDGAELRKTFAAAFRQHMSEREIDDAVMFYRSEAGRRLTQSELAHSRFMVGLSTQEPSSLSENDEREIKAFESTAAGRKARIDGTYADPEMVRKISDQAMKMVEQCARKIKQR
ncbi:DUF2059 domain-containing protein [Lysobacter capsici]|uniref:DUF2059 domain-containing protein n=1 Tax=Lysobacter capsici TaxID=435897 RepID=UPI00044A2348|nr:DUF2059 domain-containing protein [Lysobacter capsici]